MFFTLLWHIIHNRFFANLYLNWNPATLFKQNPSKRIKNQIHVLNIFFSCIVRNWMQSQVNLSIMGKMTCPFLTNFEWVIWNHPPAYPIISTCWVGTLFLENVIWGNIHFPWKSINFLPSAWKGLGVLSFHLLLLVGTFYFSGLGNLWTLILVMYFANTSKNFLIFQN